MRTNAEVNLDTHKLYIPSHLSTELSVHIVDIDGKNFTLKQIAPDGTQVNEMKITK